MKNNEQRGFKGYCTHQAFSGFQIPVPAQNAVLRDYTRRQSLVFNLSVNELNFPNCYIMLEDLIGNLRDLEGVVMVSVFMLPADTLRREQLIKRALNGGYILHFVFENIILSNLEDWNNLERIMRLKTAISRCPKTIPAL